MTLHLFAACLGSIALIAATEPQKPAPASTPASAPEATPQAPAPMREVVPGVRVDVTNKLVEIDGTIAIDAHRTNDKGQRLVVFLETLVCMKDSKEHESLVVTDAKASQAHAALLLIGLAPGTPGSWNQEREAEKSKWVGVPPTGSPVRVTIASKNADGAIGPETDALEWVVDQRDGRTFRQIEPGVAYVFAGSKMVQARRRMIDPDNQPRPEVYAGDLEGTVVGLTSFGTEAIGVTAMYSPDTSKEEPRWIASEKLPDVNTKVVVRIRPESTRN
jgi:hypothetical protein